MIFSIKFSNLEIYFPNESTIFWFISRRNNRGMMSVASCARTHFSDTPCSLVLIPIVVVDPSFITSKNLSLSFRKEPWSLTNLKQYTLLILKRRGTPSCRHIPVVQIIIVDELRTPVVYVYCWSNFWEKSIWINKITKLTIVFLWDTSRVCWWSSFSIVPSPDKNVLC